MNYIELWHILFISVGVAPLRQKFVDMVRYVTPSGALLVWLIAGGQAIKGQSSSLYRALTREGKMVVGFGVVQAMERCCHRLLRALSPFHALVHAVEACLRDHSTSRILSNCKVT